MRAYTSTQHRCLCKEHKTADAVPSRIAMFHIENKLIKYIFVVMFVYSTGRLLARSFLVVSHLKGAHAVCVQHWFDLCNMELFDVSFCLISLP